MISKRFESLAIIPWLKQCSCSHTYTRDVEIFTQAASKKIMRAPRWEVFDHIAGGKSRKEQENKDAQEATGIEDEGLEEVRERGRRRVSVS